MSDTSDSDDDGEKVNLMHNLYHLLSGIHSSGSFAASGVIDSFVNPGIFVDPIGIVRLPLSEDDAHALTQTGHKAPFGKGNETLIDESVRKTWQIDAANVRFLNENWQPCLDQIIQRAAEELGVAGGASNIRAEFYKMLLYEKGAMFKPHQDTEKVPGMFGTLIVCLPSEHTGGAVCLRHGSKSKRFDSSTNSAFGASYLTWYADVIHEIEPIQTGYRWVLAYNLINGSQGSSRSASALDARIGEFTQALTTWQDLTGAPRYLAYPLDHQYTNRDLKLAHLKGNDFYRAHHVAQSCAAHGEYYMLLGNMEMCITDRNDEEEMEKESALSLFQIVDPQGYDLINSTIEISTTNLLRGESYEDRAPDVQRGGNYLGNQYAEIDQFFRDSVLILVPSHWILNTLLGSTYSRHSLDGLMANLRGFIREAGDSSMRSLLLKVCQIALGRDYAGNKDRDLYLGPVAVSAAFLKDSNLFSTTASQIEGSFGMEYYSELGELINFQDPVVGENEYISPILSSKITHCCGFSVSTAITKCGKVFLIHENLTAFRNGFFKANPNRSDQLHVNNLTRWLDTLLYSCLYDSENVCEQDASALVRIIVEREDAPFSQFVLYQGVRIFVKYFQDTSLLTTPLVVHLLSHSNHQDHSKTYLETLLRNTIEPAISNFNLRQYASYIPSLVPPKQDSYSRSRSREQGAIATPNELSGPIKAIYVYASACSHGLPTQLLQKIQAQASELTVEQSKGFLISFLSELIPVVDVSSSEVQSCIRSLTSVYIIRTVGQEPKKPSDWARLEEVSSCPRGCDDCSNMNTFLKDPEAKDYPLDNGNAYHLRPYFHGFDYFDVKEVGWNPVAVTKTSKWWEEQHPKWEARAAEVLGAVKQLPQDRLKNCLGREYDDFMALKMVKISEEAVESGEGGKQEQELGSTVPQKRGRESSQ
ncbi:MAG: hypothetical protein Q9170_002256 [Blastenia crenularia]